MENFKIGIIRMVNLVLGIIDYIIAWLNGASGGALAKLYNLMPSSTLLENQKDKGDSQPKTKEEFLTSIDKEIAGTPIERFFKDKPAFLQSLAGKAATIAGVGTNEAICSEGLFPKTAQVTMHQQVLYCGTDDSRSMKNGPPGAIRWDSQNYLINRIARITTRILPEGEGIYLRYMNQDLKQSDSVKFDEIPGIIDSMKPVGDTPIGTNLKQKILKPLVYDKLPVQLDRPLLISIITDGAPSTNLEKESTFAEAIAECGDMLEANNLPRETVKFLIGQVGEAKAAKRFLNDLRSDPRLRKVVYVAAQSLEVGVSQWEKDSDIDRWLIETLYEPIMQAKARVNEED